MITYTIGYKPQADPNDDPDEHFDVVVTDHLPQEVYFVSANPNNGQYNPNEHIYTWYEGYVPGYDPNDPGDPNAYLTLTVQVNEAAEPMGVIVNIVEIESDKSQAITKEVTPVGCWQDVIYVDQSASGLNNGSSWQDAYLELCPALDKAHNGCGTQIRVAQGSYVSRLVEDEGQDWYYEPFDIPNGVAVYGGFPAGGGDWNQRDPVNHETILGGNGQTEYDLLKVVTFESCDENTILDGCTIIDSYSVYQNTYGIYIENGSPTVCNNRVTNHDYAIYCLNADAPVITNNWIYENDQVGLYLENVSSSGTPVATVRNNTVAYNIGDGVVKIGGAVDPNVVITNTILWKNQGEQLIGCPLVYSCIYDPVNDPNGVSPDIDENGNITADPYFVSAATDDYHLDAGSLCIDAGDPAGEYDNETDIDGHSRILDGGYDLRVDMGADELCNGSDTNIADFNDDGIVDQFDYNELSAAWLTEPPAMNTLYDLNTDDIVSLPDLSLFSDEWLWIACGQSQSMMMMGGGGDGFGQAMAPVESLSPDETEPSADTPQYLEIEFSLEQIAEFIKTHTWAADVFDDDDKNVTMSAYVTADDVYYEIHRDRPDGSHVAIIANSTGRLLRHATTDPKGRLIRLTVERWPGQGTIVFNTAYDDAGNRIVDEWTEYDSDSTVIEYVDLIALEAEARKATEQANTG